MTKIRLIAVAFWFLASATMLSAESIVVWDFATRDGASTEVTRNLTEEFEEALVQQGRYEVVERRRIDRLDKVIQNEKALTDIGQISPSSAEKLKKLGAEGVVFGDVYDDVASGEVTVTVTLQDFQGRKRWKKSVSIRRGLLADGKSRREAMANLAEEIAGITVTDDPLVGETPHGHEQLLANRDGIERLPKEPDHPPKSTNAVGQNRYSCIPGTIVAIRNLGTLNPEQQCQSSLAADGAPPKGILDVRDFSYSWSSEGVACQCVVVSVDE